MELYLNIRCVLEIFNNLKLYRIKCTFEVSPDVFLVNHLLLSGT